jgi:chitodextrinase
LIYKNIPKNPKNNFYVAQYFIIHYITFHTCNICNYNYWRELIMKCSCDYAIYPGILSLFLLIILSLNACKPAVTFAVRPNSVCFGSTVTFDASGTKDPLNDIVSYEWDLGDGATGSGKVATHLFPQPNEYTIKLVVKDSKGNMSDESKRLRIYDNPRAFVTADDNYIDSSGSTILRWQAIEVTSVSIDQGIGEVNNIGQMEVHPDVTTTYTITATGPCGTVTDSITVKVVSPICAAYIETNSTDICDSRNIIFDASKSVDPDNDILSYLWSFGDGATDSGIKTNHTYYVGGNFTASLIIKDEAGHTSRTNKFIKIYTSPQTFIRADVDKITLGGVTTIWWQASNATSIIINQNIGSVHDIGFAIVSPSATTTYTITATGPCGTSTHSVTVKVIPSVFTPLIRTDITSGCSPVTVNFDASESYDPDGDIVDYRWEFGDGAAASGATASHTYNGIRTYSARLILRDGAGHTSEAAQDIRSFGQPSLDVNAINNNVMPGQIAVIFWRASEVTSVNIDQGIGPVPSNGLITTPMLFAATTFTITATGPCGTVTESVTINVDNNVINPISISITSPMPDQNISGPEVLVQGYIDNPLGGDTMVVVNGVPAFSYNDKFVAPGVPLQPGGNALIVDAAGSLGNKGKAYVWVNSTEVKKLISISCENITGMSPMVTTFKISVPQGYVPVLSGIPPQNGNMELLEQTADYQYRVRLTGDGIYTFKASTTDASNNEFSDSISVIVQDRQKVDTKLKSMWSDMKSSLSTGDIEGALENFNMSAVDNYREIFTALGDQLPIIANKMSDLESLKIDGDIAKYRILKNQIIDGQEHTIAYYVYFSVDPFGIWSIDSF